jgi:hypothetical protein
MTSIHKEMHINASAAAVWDVLRDVGAVHTRLAPGFATDTTLEGDARLVTFANGAVVRELIVDVSDANQRIAYAIVAPWAKHHHASFQVFADGEGKCRLVWITDALLSDPAFPLHLIVEQGTAAMQHALNKLA